MNAAGWDSRNAWRAGQVAALSLFLAGCHHKPPPPVVPVPPPTPVPLAKTPETPHTVPALPPAPTPLTPVNIPAKKVKKTRKKPVASALAANPAAPAVAETPAPSTPPPSTAILGALTPGGDQTPEKQQAAQELIGANDRRLAGLPPAFVEVQKEQLARVVNFQQQAQKALQGGDADGAVTLATKAKLLLDDILNILK
jgi:outer membrane biosynthesis protein TonB